MINKADVVGLEGEYWRWICESNHDGGVIIEGGGYNDRVKTIGPFSAACNINTVNITRRIFLKNGNKGNRFIERTTS